MVAKWNTEPPCFLVSRAVTCMPPAPLTPPPLAPRTPRSQLHKTVNLSQSDVKCMVMGEYLTLLTTHKYRSDLPSFAKENGLGKFLWLRESMKNGSSANISEMKLITHTGTHVDAPGHYHDHYFDAGFDVDTLDLEVLNGN
ncbi:hypothetical protein Peur_073695 [Populus x canadensis]